MNNKHYDLNDHTTDQSTVCGLVEQVVSVPVEVLDLVRFMCATWVDIDRWAHENMPTEALGGYPQIQGTRNQINLQKIGKQEYSTKKSK